MTEITAQDNTFTIDKKYFNLQPDKLNQRGINTFKIESYDILLKICKENNQLDFFKEQIIQKLQSKITNKNIRLINAMIEYVKTIK